MLLTAWHQLTLVFFEVPMSKSIDVFYQIIKVQAFLFEMKDVLDKEARASLFVNAGFRLVSGCEDYTWTGKGPVLRMPTHD